MKSKDLRERTPEDLVELEKSLAKDVFANRLKNFTNRLDDTSSMKKARRDLARVKTILMQRKLGTTPIKLEGAAPKAEKPAPAAKAPKAAKAAKPAGAQKAEVAAPKAAASKPAKKTAKKAEAK
jgi:large subunit ribosomal protein L29